MAPPNYTAMYASLEPKLAGKTRVELLKAIEAATGDLFTDEAIFESHRDVLGPGKQDTVLKAALNQQWTGIEEYSRDFYAVYDACSARQQAQRALVRSALDAGTGHGFNPLERCLLAGASRVADSYDVYYRAWATAVQGNEVAKQLTEDDKAGIVPKHLYNHYTIISLASDGSAGDGGGAEDKYTQVAYADYLEAEIAEVVANMDAWIAELEALQLQGDDAQVQGQYVEYLKQYRSCLAERDVGKLEAMWQHLDELWVQIRYWVQVVHDIEYGYGDPLRCKVEPEFSCRLLDETYAAANLTIGKIQGVMVEYFGGRLGDLAKSGLSTLRQSCAGIYYLPYLCGAPLHFRFSGQSIPNRSEVRTEGGVKIYFDPVATSTREDFARELAAKVCADPRAADCIDTVDSIVYHVAAHEIGHAIYGLDAVKDVIKVSTKTLLEEPRAELTALHTLRLLRQRGMVDEVGCATYLRSFMLQDLRRFAMFDSSSTWPYTLSALGCWQRASTLGYVAVVDKKVVFDDAKVGSFLEAASELFEVILHAEDKRDGPAIEGVLAQLQAAESCDVCTWLKTRLYSSAGGASDGGSE